jgi:hypothetical protein
VAQAHLAPVVIAHYLEGLWRSFSIGIVAQQRGPALSLLRNREILRQGFSSFL